MKVEVVIMGFPSLLCLMVSVDVKQQLNGQELCESRGGHHGLSIPPMPYGFRGRKATVKWTGAV